MRSAPAVLRYVPLGAVRAMPALAAKSSSKLMFFGAPYHGQVGGPTPTRAPIRPLDPGAEFRCVHRGGGTASTT